VLSLLSIPSFFVVSFYKSDVNIDPRSVIMSRGSPRSLNISLMKVSWNCRASMFFVHGIK